MIDFLTFLPIDYIGRKERRTKFLDFSFVWKGPQLGSYPYLGPSEWALESSIENKVFHTMDPIRAHLGSRGSAGVPEALPRILIAEKKKKIS